MKIKQNLLNKLSFPDSDVQRMLFFESKKRIEIYLEGAYLDIDGGRFFDSGNLFIFGYKGIEAKLYDNDKWKPLGIKNYDPLKSIEEFVFREENIILRGFGKNTGKWVEYKIISPKIEANFI